MSKDGCASVVPGGKLECVLANGHIGPHEAGSTHWLGELLVEKAPERKLSLDFTQEEVELVRHAVKELLIHTCNSAARCSLSDEGRNELLVQVNILNGVLWSLAKPTSL